MYAALVNYSVKSGHLNEAIRLWREEVEPAAEGQPATKAGYYSSSPMTTRLSWSPTGTPTLTTTRSQPPDPGERDQS